MKEPMTAKGLAAMIDHSLLRADVTETELAQLCQEAVDNGFCHGGHQFGAGGILCGAATRYAGGGLRGGGFSPRPDDDRCQGI